VVGLKLVSKCLDIDAGKKPIVILNKEDAEELGVNPLDRINIFLKNRKFACIVNISKDFVKSGEIALYKDVWSELGIKEGEIIEVKRREKILSKKFIRKKIDGGKIPYEGMKEIVKDLINNNLNDLEIASFITALHIRGISLDEIVSLSKAMLESGKKISFNKKIVCDKHSLGGVPGDKTTLLVVPIIASCNLTIPKTSSRAITSPAGTADRMEVLAPVSLRAEEMKKVVEKTNGCIVWGGALDLAPADDLFIRIEQPLDLDPLYIPSIMSKKKAVSTTHLVLDIPTGRGAKVKTFGEAYEIGSDFIRVSKMLGIKTVCGITFGEQPIGYCVGPALEAREALEALINKKEPADLIDKACSLAGLLLELVGKGNKNIAYKCVLSGKAEKKLREIIKEQGGNPKIKPEDIEIGDKKVDIISQKNGIVMWIKNQEIAEIAKIAGAPKDKGAGIKLHVKIGNKVKKNQKILTIYSEKSLKLNEAEKYVKEVEPVVIIEKLSKNMLIRKLEEEKYEKSFVLER
jgi:AMP phosphorylase